jgi:hypothetical protein
MFWKDKKIDAGNGCDEKAYCNNAIHCYIPSHFEIHGTAIFLKTA